MTKAELIEEVSLAVEMTRKDSEVIVEAIFGGCKTGTKTGRFVGSERVGHHSPRKNRPITENNGGRFGKEFGSARPGESGNTGSKRSSA